MITTFLCFIDFVTLTSLTLYGSVICPHKTLWCCCCTFTLTQEKARHLHVFSFVFLVKTQIRIFICSIQAVKLHWLDKIRLYIVTNQNITFLVPLSVLPVELWENSCKSVDRKHQKEQSDDNCISLWFYTNG